MYNGRLHSFRNLFKILFKICDGCLPGCQLLVPALVQSAAGSGCGSGSWDSGTRRGPAHTLHHAALVVPLAHHCPPPNRINSMNLSVTFELFKLKNTFLWKAMSDNSMSKTNLLKVTPHPISTPVDLKGGFIFKIHIFWVEYDYKSTPYYR